MTPQILKELLTLYTDGGLPDTNSQSVLMNRDELRELGLFEACESIPGGCRVTKKGMAHANGLVKLPLPTQIWYSPADDI